MVLIVEKVLGEGANGIATLCIDDETKMEYVIKEGLNNKSKGELVNEQKILEKLRSICNPFFICVKEMENGKLIMEYVRGTFELGSYVQNNEGKLTFISKFVLIMRLLEGLKILHNFKIVHRDIKVENIIFNPKTLNVRYIDFGSACTEEDELCLVKKAGTVPCMAPEIYSSRFSYKYDKFEFWEKADVWSLGITIIDICFWDVFYGDFIIGISDDCDEECIKKRFEDIPRPSKEDLFFIKLVKKMLINDYSERPDINSIYKFATTTWTFDFLKIVNSDPEELNSVISKNKKVIRRFSVSPKTNIFPSGNEKRKTL
jgi:serine/threonine protein kinase